MFPDIPGIPDVVVVVVGEVVDRAGVVGVVVVGDVVIGMFDLLGLFGAVSSP
jgi:hypothetical protein